MHKTTHNKMKLQGDDVTVNLTTNVSLLPGVHVEQNEEAPCPIDLTTSNKNGNDTLTTTLPRATPSIASAARSARRSFPARLFACRS